MAEWKVIRHFNGGHWHMDPYDEFAYDEGGHCFQEYDEVFLADGTIATVLGFRQEEAPLPKTWLREDRAWLRLRLPNGNELDEFAGHVMPVDKIEYQRRYNEWFEAAYEWYGGKEKVLRERQEREKFLKKQET